MATDERRPAQAAALSRRELIAGGSAFAAGVTLGAIFGGAGLKVVKAQGVEVPPWPWPYQKLDPEAVAQRGYEGYFKGGCCYGASDAIIGELAVVVGEPYTIFPVDLFRYGAGGVAGWGTLCGALNGAAAAVALVTPKEVSPAIIGELMGWYTQTAFPNWKPAGKTDLPTSVSGSPLCHASVSKWCVASGYTEGSQERKERCARLTGAVAAHAVELLNAHFDGRFAASFVAPASVTECMSCHGKDGMDNTLGKMDCGGCHTPHQI